MKVVFFNPRKTQRPARQKSTKFPLEDGNSELSQSGIIFEGQQLLNFDAFFSATTHGPFWGHGEKRLEQ